MKRALLVFFCCNLFLLAACSDSDTVKNPETNDNLNTTNTSNEGSSTQTEGNQTSNEGTLPFRSFELDVDYDRFTSYEVDYDIDEDGIEAKIDDEINKKVVKGDKAYKEIQAYFKQLTFNETTADSEVIEEVLKVFNLKSDYIKFELEVTFNNGIEKEYRIQK